MKKLIENYLASKKIEYYGILAYSDCYESAGHIMAREDFTPRSVIVYLVPYYAGETENLSRYAASLDYHVILKEIGEGLIEGLKAAHPGCSARSYGDHSPIAECHAAASLGLGVIGDNGLIINEKYGSYVFVGDVVTDIEPELLGAVKPVPVSRCLRCGACKRACPTGILAGAGSDCLSAITQRKGELSDWEANLIRECNTAWGCDLCQSCCPYNANPTLTPLEFFYRDRLPRIDSGTVEAMSKETFSRRAFAWRGKKTLLRNLTILEAEREEK